MPAASLAPAHVKERLMWKKIAVAGGAGVAVLAVAAAALAQQTGSAPSPSPAASGSPASSATSAPKPQKHEAAKRLALRLRNFEHAEWVSRDNSKHVDVTHDAIRGSVTAVNSTSISVKAIDGFSLSYTINGDTKVAERDNGKGSAKKGTIGDVKTGDHVVVTGVKAGTVLTANRVLDTGTN
jgi:hypothetical protein